MSYGVLLSDTYLQVRASRQRAVTNENWSRGEDDSDEWTLTENEVLKTYEPLLDGQTRLLRLLPGKGNETVCCELVAVELDSSPAYEAISYAWGKSSNVTKFTLNGKLCWRKHNLLECLESLRHKNDIRDLWVDALCINQANTEEKSAQINLMPHIYRSAKRTLIWLGKDDTHDVGHDMKFEYDPAYTKALPRLSEGLNLLNHFAQDGHLENDRHFYQLAYMLAHISGFEWWCRVWVVQETLLSESAHLVLGKFMLPWNTAYQAAINIVHHMATCCSQPQTMSKKDVYTPAIKEYLAECAQVILSFRLVPSGTSNVLLATLWMFRNRLASVRHDKIYGLLGLILSSQSCIQPDYSKSFQEVCRLAVSEDIRVSGNLNALRGSRLTLSEFSSWSIDWSDLDYWTEDRSRILCDLYGPAHRASGSSQPRINTREDEEEADSELHVAGHIFDFVSSKSQRLILSEDLYAESRSRPSLLTSAKKVCGRIQGDDYVGGGSVFNACWRTLLGDSLISYHDSHNPLRSIQSAEDNSSSKGSPARRVKASDFFAFALWRANEMKKEEYPQDDDRLEADDLPENEVQRSHLGNNTSYDAPAIRNIKASVVRATSGRCMFLTDQGYLGLGPESIRIGDSVAILLGGSTPFIIRKSSSSTIARPARSVVGECYVHGWMDGEMMRDQDTAKWDDLVLV